MHRVQYPLYEGHRMNHYGSSEKRPAAKVMVGQTGNSNGNRESTIEPVPTSRYVSR